MKAIKVWGIAALALLAVAIGCANPNATPVPAIPAPTATLEPTETPAPTATAQPTAILAPTATPEPTAIPEVWGRFTPKPMDGTCYRLENSLCVSVHSVDWDAPANMPEVTVIGDTRSFGFTDRPPAGYKFVVIELYVFNAGNNEINTEAIWLGEMYSIGNMHREANKELGIEVMGQGTNSGILNLDINLNPETGEQDGCTTFGYLDIPDAWVEGFSDIYVPPGENLPWQLCFVVPEADLSTLVLKWPHFVEGPPVWFALRPEPQPQ